MWSQLKFPSEAFNLQKKMGIEKDYQELAKKHGLPSYEEMNSEFEIFDIDEESFILREVRRKITQKLETYNKILEGILKPEVALCDLHECKVFTDKEKGDLFELYKKLMHIDRHATEVSINEEEKTTSQFIKETWKEWPGIKKQLKEAIKKLKQSWLEESDVKDELGYLG